METHTHHFHSPVTKDVHSLTTDMQNLKPNVTEKNRILLIVSDCLALYRTQLEPKRVRTKSNYFCKLSDGNGE